MLGELHRPSTREVPLLELPPSALLDLLASGGGGSSERFLRAAHTAARLRVETAVRPLHETLVRHAAQLRPHDFAVSTREGREALLFVEAAVEGLALLASPAAFSALGPFLEGPPPLSGWVALHMGEAAHESAREPLFAVATDRRYDPTARSRAAFLLVNRLNDRRGLGVFASGLAAESEPDFEAALSAFHGVAPQHRDEAYFVPVLEAFDAHAGSADRLAGLFGLVLGAGNLPPEVLRAVGKHLEDRRRQSGRHLAARPLSIERFAVAAVARCRHQRGEAPRNEEAAFSRNPLRFWRLKREVQRWLAEKPEVSR
jgi:hypothetical protein